MGKEHASNALHKHAGWLNSAENHVGDLIAQIRQMQELEQMDIDDAREQRARLQMMEIALVEEGLPNLAAHARAGADLEAEQILRNEILLHDQALAIALLQAVASGINRLRQFAVRIARATSEFFA